MIRIHKGFTDFDLVSNVFFLWAQSGLSYMIDLQILAVTSLVLVPSIRKRNEHRNGNGARGTEVGPRWWKDWGVFIDLGGIMRTFGGVSFIYSRRPGQKAHRRPS